MARTNFQEVLRTLGKHGVEFVVVGGVAAVLQGAPISTFDLDVVHSRSADNISRLLRALKELEAFYRTQPQRRLKPNESHLSSPGHQLLTTCFGPLDLLGEIAAGYKYEKILSESVAIQVGKELTVRVLNLEALIKIKEQLGEDKDRAVIPVLHRTLEEKRRRSS